MKKENIDLFFLIVFLFFIFFKYCCYLVGGKKVNEQCKCFKCLSSGTVCIRCDCSDVCFYSGSCEMCLYGSVTDFIACPNKPLNNFSRADKDNK
ncbi:MAG: hypothetical protein J6K58_14155 [Lachnospiraceae bacterium]|nr:hypothetical protein [Lachnospiraceae bacterium]